MPSPIAGVARSLPEAARAVRAIARPEGGAALGPFSLRSYLADPGAPSRIVLCAAGAAPGPALAFLRSTVPRLLWPAPSARLAGAIGGLLTRHSRGPRRLGPSSRPAEATALLLEGVVNSRRLRAALLSAAPGGWIVESARHVRAPSHWLGLARRAGVRWSALAPIELVAVFVGPELWKRRSRWRRLLPPDTPVWTAGGPPGVARSKALARGATA